MANIREHSKDYNWDSDASIENINAGSLQRIADAAEKMASNYIRMENDLKYFKRLYEERGKEIARLVRSNNALRGHIKRMKKII